MTYEPLVECSGCKSSVHWLDLFSNQLCSSCHEIATSEDTPEELYLKFMPFFGGKK